MQYLVVAEDGNKYGPADYDVLVAWVAEGRIVGQTLIEDVKTGRQTIASSIPGLIAQPPVQPSIQTAYPRFTLEDDGSKELKNAWIFFGLCLIPFCTSPIFAALGIHNASIAKRKGNSLAVKPERACIAVLIIYAFFYLALRLPLWR